MSISAEQVRQLRERTGAGLMECKKFLMESHGDIEKAIENMRKTGATKAAKKEGRITAEGVIMIRISEDGKRGVILEVNSETDFVARGDDFKAFAKETAEAALNQKARDMEALKQQTLSAGHSVEEVRQQLVAKIGENIHLRRFEYLETEGTLYGYVHGDRIGVLAALSHSNETLGKDMAMHIAASNPLVTTPDKVPATLLDKEREIYIAQAKESGKPQAIIEKMVEGNVRKYLEQVSLSEQPFIKDPNKKVGNILSEGKNQVVTFVRYEVGEGIEKQVQNFAEEVMAQVRGSE